jgi:RNA polymerase sigma-70 factor (ECF subfamily)
MYVRSCMTDPDAFTSLYRQHSTGIYRFALHMSGSTSVAEEVTQDTFVTLMHKPHGYDASRGEVGPFLYGVARNLVRRHLERDRRQLPFDDGEEENLCSAVDDPLGDLTQKANLQALRDAVAALPPKYREVVVLCDLQEMSYEAAAQAIDCAVGTVRSRLHRARALLVSRMQVKCHV